jgi:hypothetical protein
VRRAILLALCAALCVPALAEGAGPLPRGWPERLELGLSDSPGGAAALRRTARVRLRYQYLAAGVNTGEGWATWNPDGSFVTRYVRESRRAGLIPVFSYYMIRHSLPGRDVGDEARADLGNLANRDTMRAYYADLRLLMRRAGSRPVVVQVEPDLWGYGQQAARGDRASTVPAAVDSSGDPDAAGLPNTLAGFARAVVRIRDRHAPNVILGYHVSVWGTGTDIALQDPPGRRVDALARRAARFYRSLGARFGVTFAEFDDRDAGFNQLVNGDGGASWWRAGDFGRDVRFTRVYSRAARQRVVKWQIPVGNTLMRAVDDTWGHYGDNRVQWLLGERGRRHLRRYRAAGVVGLLFGGGAEGTTCACDARGDGVTNPAPIRGNRRRSLSADDDGGYFKARARAYRRAGPLRLGR